MELGTDIGSRGGDRRDGVRTRLRTPLDEEIVPNSGWTEDSECYYLLVDLPGFRKDEVKLEVDDSGHIIVRGERVTHEQKRLHFEQIFEIPNDSDKENISGHIDSEILYVRIPKLIISSQENNRESEITEEEAAKNGNVDERVVVEETENHKEQINNAVKNNNEWRGQSQQNHRERKEKEQIRKSEYENAYVDGFSKEVIRKWVRESSGMSWSGAGEVLMRNKGIVITAVIAFSFGLYVSHKFHSLTAP